MMTLKSLLAEGREVLTAAQIADADIDAWLLLQYVTGINRMMYLMEPDKSVSDEDTLAYREVIARRATHYPLQYITHTQEFMGLDFYVDERVLIPRQDTEVLVEEALSCLKSLEKPHILDMCTGSGCILLSLLMELSDASGTGVDVSEGALCVARENRKRLGLTERAELIQSDLFSADYFGKNSGKEQQEYDMLISNPPYIRTADIEGLMDEVRLHDPRIALDGMADGLYFYEKITEQAGAHLKLGGWLMYEIGCDQGADVAAIMKKNNFTEIEVKKDLAGLDRVVKGRKTTGKPTQEEQNV